MALLLATLHSHRYITFSFSSTLQLQFCFSSSLFLPCTPAGFVLVEVSLICCTSFFYAWHLFWFISSCVSHLSSFILFLYFQLLFLCEFYYNFLWCFFGHVVSLDLLISKFNPNISFLFFPFKYFTLCPFSIYRCASRSSRSPNDYQNILYLSQVWGVSLVACHLWPDKTICFSVSSRETQNSLYVSITLTIIYYHL